MTRDRVSREVRDAKDAAVSRSGNFWLTDKKMFFVFFLISAMEIYGLDFKIISSQNFAKLKNERSLPNLLVNNFLVLNLNSNTEYLILS